LSLDWFNDAVCFAVLSDMKSRFDFQRGEQKFQKYEHHVSTPAQGLFMRAEGSSRLLSDVKRIILKREL